MEVMFDQEHHRCNRVDQPTQHSWKVVINNVICLNAYCGAHRKDLKRPNESTIVDESSKPARFDPNKTGGLNRFLKKLVNLCFFMEI